MGTRVAEEGGLGIIIPAFTFNLGEETFNLP